MVGVFYFAQGWISQPSLPVRPSLADGEFYHRVGFGCVETMEVEGVFVVGVW